jgi:hypothetical protein
VVFIDIFTNEAEFMDKTLQQICLHYDTRKYQTTRNFTFDDKTQLSQVMVFWVMTSCSHVVRYHQHFEGPCCLHHQGEVNVVGKGGIDTGRECKRA